MKRMLLGMLFSGALLVPAFGMNIKIPSLDLYTWIFGYNGQLVTQSQMNADILIEGGYKFGAKITIGFDGIMGLLSTPGVGQALPPVTFKAVSLEVRDVFGIPLSLSYFMGQNDYLCYGDAFPRLFGASDLRSTYLATYIIPNLAYMFEYKGIHRVNGTGIKLEYSSPEQPFGFDLYVYQDQNFATLYNLYGLDIATGTPVLVNLNYLFYATGIYACDFRFFINREVVKLELFGGGSIVSGSWTGYVRFGALAYVGLGPVDFLLEAGVPKYGITGGAFNVDLVYALFESRINLGPVSITPTAFMHPRVYLQQDTPLSANQIDFNLRLAVFNPRRDPVSVGAEGNLATHNLLNGAPSSQLKVLPFISFATAGVFWEIKGSMVVLDSAGSLTFENMLATIQGLVTVKAEF